MQDFLYAGLEQNQGHNGARQRSYDSEAAGTIPVASTTPLVTAATPLVCAGASYTQQLLAIGSERPKPLTNM